MAKHALETLSLLKRNTCCTATHISLLAKASGCCSLNSATSVIQFGVISGRIGTINLSMSSFVIRLDDMQHAYVIYLLPKESIKSQNLYTTWIASIMDCILSTIVRKVIVCISEVASHRVWTINTDHSSIDQIYYFFFMFCTLRLKSRLYWLCVKNTVWIRPWICLQSVLTTSQRHFPVDSLRVFLYVMLGIAIWCSIWLNILSTSNHIPYTVCDIMDFTQFYGFFHLTQAHLSKVNYSKISGLF